VRFALIASVSLAACASVPSPDTAKATSVAAASGPGATAPSFVLAADLVALADRLPAGDPEASCTGKVTVTIDPTPRGALRLATARFEVTVANCAADTVITDVHVHRGSENVLAIDATISQLTLTNGKGSGSSINPGVRPSAIDEIVADITAFYVNLHSKRHPAGFMRGELRRGL